MIKRQHAGIPLLGVMVLLISLGTSGCGTRPGDSGDARAALRDTAENIDRIKTADIDLELTLHGAGESSDSERVVGFEVHGPLELNGYDEAPRADIRYIQIAGDERGEARLVSDGTRAAAITDAGTTPVDPAELSSTSAGNDKSLGDELSIGRWIDRERIEDGPERQGEQTLRITGTLDAVALVEDLSDIAAQLGADSPLASLKDKDRKQIERAVRKAEIEILTERDDRLLRELEMTLELDPPDDLDLPREAREQLATTLELRLRLDDLNREVRVDEDLLS